MKRSTPNEPAESSPPAKPAKKRSPMLVAASAAQRHAKLTEQIERAEERLAVLSSEYEARVARIEETIGNWGDERREIRLSLDAQALEVFDRMVGDE